jgi:hypothetical protein
MTRNTQLLDALAHEYGGAGFWTLIEDDRLICLNSVVTTPMLDPGFKPGEARRLAETSIPRALSRREPIFVPEQDRRRTTLLIPMRSPRGHDLGWVGLSLPPDADLPSPDMIKDRIATMAATL